MIPPFKSIFSSLLVVLILIVYLTRGDRPTSGDPSTRLDERVRALLLREDDTHPGRTNPEIVLNGWTSFVSRARQWSSDIVTHRWRPYIESKLSLTSGRVSRQCSQDINRALDGFQRLDTWAVQSMS